MTPSAVPSVSARVAAVDVARGLALVGMGAYHLSWDLAYFGLAPPGLPFSWPMRVFSHVVGGAFLALAGVSLAMAHREGPRWPGFFKRLGRIAAAAALVSVVTWFVAPESPILFGILHCIAAASLLAAPFLRAPGAVAVVAGLIAVAAPLIYASAAFDAPAVIWLGLGVREPATLDWRPLLPWAGVMLIGLGLAKRFLPRLLASPLARWRSRRPPARGLAFAGRHSLAVYLIHQPVLLALLYAGVQETGFAERREGERYLSTCKPACVEAGGEIEACAKACACVVRKATNAGLAASLTARGAAETDRARVGEIVETCGSESP